MYLASGPATPSWLSIRAPRPARNTMAATLSPWTENLMPTRIFFVASSSLAASTTAVPSGS